MAEENKEQTLNNVGSDRNELSKEVDMLADVTSNLSELLTNSVNMVDKYYEIFFDQHPHYVELEQYDSNGNLYKTLVPNRALDRSVALSGTEDPEDLVDGVLGSLYVNNVTRDLFIKKTAEGNNGWVNITPQKLEMYTETFHVGSTTAFVLLLRKAYSKDYIDVYVNGRHLEQSEYDLAVDRQTLEFNTQFPDYAVLEVKYMDGLYGLKGDTALTVTVGKTHTVNTETPAKVENVGNDEDLILDFTIPKGETGDSGVWVGEEPPIENEEYLDDKVIWIDTSAEGYSESDLAVTRIFDSGNNTNPTAYSKALKLMHSSIDSAKYAELGDVNVSDKGILTAYGNGSGIRTTVKVKQLLDQEWSISGRDYLDINKGTHQYLFTIGGQTTESTTFFFRSENKSFCLRDRKEGTVTDICDNNSQDLYDTYGEGWYNWKVEYREGLYYIYVSYNDFPLALRHVVEHTPIDQPLEEYIYISADSDMNYSQMESDLTVYCIRIDGEVIWTPNFTEFNPVVEERFSLVGGPVVSDSGVLTRVTNGTHFIYGDYTAGELLNKSWEIQGEFIHLGNSQVLWQFADPEHIEAQSVDVDPFAGDYKMMSMVINGVDNALECNLMTGEVDNKSVQLMFPFALEVNKEYFYKYAFNEHDFTYTFTVSTDKQFLKDVRTQSYHAATVNRYPLVVNSHPEYKIVLGTGSSVGTESLTIYNDLNYFKIYNRNKVVYRPLFRIPCTVSKYGVKFVDSSLRWMVDEAYELYGKGDMFVIDEEGQAVTLPLSDVYSLIQREYETRPIYGKGLKYDPKTNILENLTQGTEIGDVGESVFVDETSGLRRILNGQTINVTKDTKEFAKYVLKLKDVGLVVTNERWESEVTANGTCNKFVVDVETKTETVKYIAYIPDSFVIRTPIIEDGEGGETQPDVEESIPERYCKNCGAKLEPDQLVCTVCFSVNELSTVTGGTGLEGDNITHDEIIEDQLNNGSGETGEEDNVEPELPPEEEDKIIGYEISISSDLTESDIVYTTSLNPLDKGVVFRKIDGIIYPEYEVSVEEIINEDLYYRYEKADFEVTEEIEAANYIRLPKLNASKDGYQCYIQVATGVKTTVDVENTYTHISPFSYGMYQYSDIELNNPGWLLSEGQWNSGAIYPSFYRWIRKQIDLGRDKFKLWNNPNYSVNRYDYVINEADGTFRLPLVASVSDFAQQRFLVDKKEATDADPTWYNIYSDGWCEQGGREVILSGSAAALNYTNKTMVLPVPILHAINWNVQPRHDCFGGNMGSMTYMASYESVTIGQKNMNAATAYTNPWVVWSLEGYVSEATLAEHFKLANLYFYVGDTVQTNNHIDTGKLLEEIAKARQELNRIKNALSIPSETYTELSCPASGGTWTAIANGWLTFRRTATGANQWLLLTDTATGLAQIQWLPASNNYAIINIPVRKGAVIKIEYSAGTHNYLRFIPAKEV